MLFQSTLPRGERQRIPTNNANIDKISIHAPTRGATALALALPSSTRYFNPRSHEGSDPVDSDGKFVYRDFNPRSHEGSDVSAWALPSSTHYFNPRSHEGSDVIPFAYRTLSKDFNPRSHEGSDVSTCRAFFPWYISIHAPTRGATDTILMMEKEV